MKKVVLSLAGVLAATAFAPEASAVPAFARQTGMACSACHYQHFPLLNGFGRAFKSSGFTLMGAQGKIEGENLSMPDQVNMAVFTTAYFQTENSGKTGGVANPATATKWGVPSTGGEFSLFMGGRASEFAGFLAEAGLGGGGASDVTSNGTAVGNGNVIGTAPGGGVVGAAKIALLFPVGDARVGTIIHSSQGQGVAYSFELLNTGAANTHKLMGNSGPSGQHVKATSAAQYLGTNTAATGISLVANNSMGFINLGAYEMAGNDAVGGANNLNLTYVRVAGTMDVAGFDAGFGVQNFGGTSNVTMVSPKATIIDAQLQGDLGAMPVGFYASYGTAAAGTAAANGANPFNEHMAWDAATGTFALTAGTKAKTSFNLAAELGIIPHVSTIQVAIRKGNNGAASKSGDNALMFGVTYELAQNLGLSFHHTAQYGDAWGADAAGNQPAGRDANTLLLEALF